MDGLGQGCAPHRHPVPLDPMAVGLRIRWPLRSYRRKRRRLFAEVFCFRETDFRHFRPVPASVSLVDRSAVDTGCRTLPGINTTKEYANNFLARMRTGIPRGNKMR